MFFYGLLVDDLILIIVNAVGFTLEAVYLVFYLFYTQSKVRYLIIIYVNHNRYSLLCLNPEKANTSSDIHCHLNIHIVRLRVSFQ